MIGAGFAVAASLIAGFFWFLISDVVKRLERMEHKIDGHGAAIEGVKSDIRLLTERQESGKLKIDHLESRCEKTHGRTVCF